MPCYHPLPAFQCADGSVVFQERRGRDSVRSLLLPCGQCVGCRLARSRMWALRCVHESQMYERNCFITLTYGEDCPDGLVYRHFQLFMKRLRKRAPGVRFFMCGEYGEDFGRPHFHACIFNYDFKDKLYFKLTDTGEKIYTSVELSRLWPHGYSSTAMVSFQSAAYVARYVMKKVTGQDALEHYGSRQPEFCHMSLKPAVGRRWIEKYMSDVYPDGFVVMNGVRQRPPKYYDKMLKRAFPDAFDWLAYKRDVRARANFGDNSVERLAVKEVVEQARVNFLKRGI